MKNKQPLLSICIPTYNRGDILNETLFNITSDPDFDEEVEIVISDNGSNDNTPDIGKKYSKTFSNIKYYRNEENIKIKNFYSVLSRGNGKFLKLVNDTASFQPNKLSKLKAVIRESHSKAKSILFASINYYVNDVVSIEVRDQNALLKYLSYNTTWSPNFGIWKDDLQHICQNTDYKTQMPQVDWLYRLVKIKPMILYFDSYFNIHWTGRKDSYNYMHTFVDVYLNMLRGYRPSLYRFEVEKFRLLFMLSSFYYFMKVSKNISYNSDGALKIMYKEYWYEPYFYVLFPSYLFMRFIYEKFLKAIRYKQ